MAGLLEYTKNGQVTEPPLYRFMRGNVQSFLNSIPDPSGLTREEQLNLAANVTPTMGLLGTFIGKGSKLWNSKTNDVAKALEKEGVAPETIWSQTGNVKAPDGKWRQEIADTNVDLVPNYKKLIKDYGVRKQSGILSHNNLYEAYPELKDAYMQQLRASEVASGTRGSAGNNTIELNFSKDPKNKLISTALHENQHLIQDLENTARGGSPENFPSSQDINDAKIMANLINKGSLPSEASKWFKDNLNRNPSLSAMDLATKQNVDLFNMPSATNQYERLLGEAEARLTENRFPLTQEQRLQYYPYAQGQYGLDVPYGELIVQGLLK